MLVLNITVTAVDRDSLHEALNKVTKRVNTGYVSKGKQPQNNAVPNYAYEYSIEEVDE